MSKKKSILVLITSFCVLVLVVLVIIFSFILNIKPQNKIEYSLAPPEEVIIDISNKEIPYFTTLDYLKEDINTVSPNFKNVTIYESGSTYLKNITLYNTIGNFSVNCEGEKIVSSSFESMELTSVNDVHAVFDRINEEFTRNNKIKKSDIYITDGNKKQKLKNIEDLYGSSKSLIVEYSTNEADITIETVSGENCYVVLLSITSKV